MLDQALQLLNQGFSVVAARQDDKRPVANWTEYQKRLPTEEELRKWFSDNPKSNIGFITGPISGFFVLDIESSVNVDEFIKSHPIPPTTTVRTGSNGTHFYFKYPKDGFVPTKARIFGKDSKWQVDVRGSGGFVVCPPSIHPVTKKPYEWLVGLDALAPAPPWLLSWANAEAPYKEIGIKPWEDALEGASEGSRNVSLTSFVGLMMKNLPPKVWDTAIPAAMRAQNAKFKPPLPEHELKTIYLSIKRKELARRQATGETEELDITREPISIKDLYEKQFPENKWLIKELIPINSICVMSSPPGYYKTWILLEMATKISQGKKVFNEYDTTLSSVMIVNEENWEGLMQARLRILVDSDEITANNVYFYNQANIKLGSKEVEFLIKQCNEKSVKFIIFDSLIRIHSFDENDASKVKEVFEHLKKFTLAGINVLFTHHHRKQGAFKPANPSEQMRGSTDIAAMVDTHLLVDKKKINTDNGDEIILVISQPKQRVKENLPDFKVKMEKTENKLKFIYDGPYNSEDEKSAKINAFVPLVLNFIKENQGCVKKDIDNAFTGKIGTNYISKVLKKLETDMEIDAFGKPKAYSLHFDSQEVLEMPQAEQEELSDDWSKSDESL